MSIYNSCVFRKISPWLTSSIQYYSMPNQLTRSENRIMRQDNLSLKHRGGLLLLAALLSVGYAEVLHVNVRTGNDGNCGTQPSR